MPDKKDNELGSLQLRQDQSFRCGSQPIISGFTQAKRFFSNLGIALRYGPAKDLPLASLYRAFAGPEPGKAALTSCIALTNRLMAEAVAIEVHVIGDRVTLVHRSLIPALYTLVRRGRSLDDLEGLSANARIALVLLRDQREVTAGEVRRRLGLPFHPQQDPAYAALGELERRLLVDRGPFRPPKSGIPYLSREGYPYHLFHVAHPDLVSDAEGHSLTAAGDAFLAAYLRGAVFASVRKLARLFKVFLSTDEIEAAVKRLSNKGKVTVRESGRDAVVASCR